MTLEEYLRLSRKSQTAFAKEVDVRQATVSRWLKGVRTPSVSVLRRIKKATSGAVGLEDFAEREAR